VRSLVGDMDGKAWVEDTESGGARFVVELAAP
jgi:K+-sensing histidine kinase KdpD